MDPIWQALGMTQYELPTNLRSVPGAAPNRFPTPFSDTVEPASTVGYDGRSVSGPPQAHQPDILRGPGIMNVVLLGMKHCGKSTVGRGLAARWNCPFHDLDERIEAAYARETNLTETGQPMSVHQIFETRGEQYFNQIEQRVIHRLYNELHLTGQLAVLSLGGRTPLNPALQDLLPVLGTCVFLKVDSEELLRRIKRNGLPPFLDASDPLANLVRLVGQREPAYQQLAELTVELGGLNPAESVDRVLNIIEEYQHGRQ